MTVDQLRRVRQATPFQPFRICLADGRELPVPHREFIHLPAGWNRSFIVTAADESYKIVDLLMVISLDFDKGSEGPSTSTSQSES